MTGLENIINESIHNTIINNYEMRKGINWKYISNVLSKIDSISEGGKISKSTKEKLKIAVFFHRAKFNSAKTNNVEASIELLDGVDYKWKNEVIDAIMFTKFVEPSNALLSSMMCQLLFDIYNGDPMDTFEFESGMRADYPNIKTSDYIVARMMYLENIGKLYSANTRAAIAFWKYHNV